MSCLFNLSPCRLKELAHVVGFDQPWPDLCSACSANNMESSDYKPDAAIDTNISEVIGREVLDLSSVLARPDSQQVEQTCCAYCTATDA